MVPKITYTRNKIWVGSGTVAWWGRLSVLWRGKTKLGLRLSPAPSSCASKRFLRSGNLQIKPLAFVGFLCFPYLLRNFLILLDCALISDEPCVVLWNLFGVLEEHVTYMYPCSFMYASVKPTNLNIAISCTLWF